MDTANAEEAADLRDRALSSFRDAYGGPAEFVAQAPGRVELLGNHTDYNGGLVLAAAVDRWTVAAGRLVVGRAARVRSAAFPGEDRFDVGAIAREGPAWGRYARGVAWALGEWAAAPLRSGFEAALVGDVPLGSGLSSSASLEAAFGLLLIALGLVRDKDVADLNADGRRLELAQVLRRAENDFVGVASGLLDQFSSLFGRAGHALMLDCRTLAFERVPLTTPAPAIVICDSKTSRRLADGMYNRRRAECERVVASFQQVRGGDIVTQLRDLTLADLETAWDRLDPVGRRRARHVLTENERVRQGVALLKEGDLVGFGRLMSASHASSRDDFENSSEALDALIEVAKQAPGFLGGKLSGAGWAGCTVNLVAMDQAIAFADHVTRAYRRRTNVTPEVHICRAADGASAEKVEDIE
jgi:galactokinase